MCAISGIHSTNKSSDFLIRVAKNMATTLSHRGPDDEGVWCNDNIALSHRRLSIVDLSSAGHQPMTSHCGRYTMVFNGEIYNHRSLRKKIDVLNSGIAWSSQSDTEVLLMAIAIWGLEKTLQECVGMFAIALWDNLQKELFLARDRFGEKPLYYGHVGGDFVFASELKAIEIHPEFDRRIDRKSVASYLNFSYIPSPNSIYQGIYKLPPSHILRMDFSKDGASLFSYWSLKDNAGYEYLNVENSLEKMHDVLSSSITDQMVANVPVGAFLSGGVDSSLIAALMQENSSLPINTFTIGYKDATYDESLHARLVAQHLGTNHTE